MKMNIKKAGIAAAATVATLSPMVASATPAFATGPVKATVAHAAPAASNIVAVYGHTSNTIKAVQQDLIKLGYLGSGYDTGYYGSLTKNAVVSYQKHIGAKADGGLTQAEFQKLQQDSKNVKTSIVGTSASKLDKRCLTGARVACIDKESNTLYLVENGKVKKSFIVRVGKGQYSTRLGVFHIYDKIPNAWSHLYHVVMPLSLPFDGGIYLHYSQQYHDEAMREGFLNAAKHNSSHGCVNVGNYADQKFIYDTLKIGDKVVVY